ncbi:hypothetical protein ACFWB0_06180 [Rhodococcus sp. NPDC060086]|uniref:hypothetical protein n=1 Tax=Rhodococcus sp. NPDC060086 TaxID=3347055 RepID=UPI00364F9092
MGWEELQDEEPAQGDRRAIRRLRFENSPGPYERDLREHLQQAHGESRPDQQDSVTVVDVEMAAAHERAQERSRRGEARRRKLQAREEIRYKDDEDLDRGKQLGAGGQGAVYELIEDSSQVAKYWAEPLDRGFREFEELVHRKVDVEVAISGYPIQLCWPDSPIRKDGKLWGYTMPMISEQFYFNMTLGSVTKQKLRELQHAIPRHAEAIPFPFDVDDHDRLELVRLVAVFLDGMHRNDIAYGDFSWMNFTFSLNPVELCVLDFDSSRVQGSLPFTRSLPIDSPDWEDPQSQGAVVARLDSDRYKFALFAYRMLVAKSLHAEIDSDRLADWSSDPCSKLVGKLWTRSIGTAGSRPQLSQWVEVLDRARTSDFLSRAH